MEDNEIRLDILSKENFLEEYNENRVSSKMIDYIIDEASHRRIKSYKILIDNKCNLVIDYKKMITEGLKLEYNKSLQAHRSYDVEQIIFFLIGITLLFLSGIITVSRIISQVLIIIAWVPIWKTVEVELLQDRKGIRRRRTIKKLLNSEISIIDRCP